MSKIFTEEDLSNKFDEDLIWRRKELSDIKSAIKNADAIAKIPLLKALVAMAYAHWEGYIKLCTTGYFDYVMIRKAYFSELEIQFYINNFLARLNVFYQSRASLDAQCNLITDIINGQAERFGSIDKDLVNTKSNLNTDVVKDICRICSVDGSFFETKRIFIDKMLLKRRNSIAHGEKDEESIILETEIDNYVGDVISLMEHFRTLLENKVYQKSYRRKSDI